jgi:hypothetical protein
MSVQGGGKDALVKPSERQVQGAGAMIAKADERSQNITQNKAVPKICWLPEAAKAFLPPRVDAKIEFPMK